MSRTVRYIAIILAFCLLLTGCGYLPPLPGVGAAAPETAQEQTAAPGETATAPDERETEPERILTPYEPIRVYCGGLLTDRGYIRDERVYISADPYYRALGIDPETQYAAGVLSVTAPGFLLEANMGQDYVTVNGRYIFSPGGFLMVGDEPFFSVPAVETAFDTTVNVAEDKSRVELTTDDLTVITGGEDYYALRFDSTDVFWLSRIIYAEATYQPLEGRIAVGNVILNRMEYPEYPDTVYDVIFDKHGGTQFDPAYDGTIFNQSDELSLIATYLAMEGVNTAEDSYFFVNPRTGEASWFKQNLVFVKTIAEHDFYTFKQE